MRVKSETGPSPFRGGEAAVPVSARLKRAVRSMMAPGALILLVLGSIFTGTTTVREASGVGAVGSFLLILIYRRFSWKLMQEALQGTAKSVPWSCSSSWQPTVHGGLSGLRRRQGYHGLHGGIGPGEVGCLFHYDADHLHSRHAHRVGGDHLPGHTDFPSNCCQFAWTLCGL